MRREKNYELEAVVSRVVKTIGILFPQGRVDVREDYEYRGFEIIVRTNHPGFGEWCSSYHIRPEEFHIRRGGYSEYLMEHIPQNHLRAVVQQACRRAEAERFSGDWNNRQARW